MVENRRDTPPPEGAARDPFKLATVRHGPTMPMYDVLHLEDGRATEGFYYADPEKGTVPYVSLPKLQTMLDRVAMGCLPTPENVDLARRLRLTLAEHLKLGVE